MLHAAIVIFCGLVGVLIFLLARRLLLLRRCRIDAPCLAPRAGLFRKLQEDVLGPPPAIDASIGSARDAAQPWSTRQSPRVAELHGDGRRSSPAVLADGLTPAAGYAWTWAHVDHHLFDAVGHMTHETVNSVADLGHVIQDHHWAASAWAGPSEKLIDSVKGHLAEWLVANHLTAGGVAVTMPEHANQAGWDMIAGDHKLNVKAWSNASAAIHTHFADPAHADIGLVFPGDSAHLPHDALHFDASHGVDLGALPDHHGILVDDALSHVDAGGAAQDGVDVAAGHAHLHLPWITLCLASCREGSLLLNGHTDLMRAGKNVAVTTAAVGAGGAIGAKVGAVIGTLLAPGIGTIIGTAIGGFAGAVTGREYADEVRLRPLHEAKAAYDQALFEFRGVQSRIVPQADAQWYSFYSATDEWLRSEGVRCEQDVEEALQAAQRSLKKAKTLPAEKIKAALDAAESELRPHVDQARSQWLAVPIWRRWLWPTEHELSLYKRYRQLRRDFAAWKKKRRALEKHMRQRRASVEEALDLMLVASCAQKAVVAYTKRCGIARTTAVATLDTIRQGALTKIASARATAVKNLKTQRDSIVKWVESQLAPTIARATQTQSELLAEMRKAGISPEAPG